MNQEGVTNHSGFPNPATDSTLVSLDIAQLLIKHPASTFFMEIEGHGWDQYGIFNGSIVVIDRSLRPANNDLVVYWDDHEFTINHKKKIPLDTSIWGVVSAVVNRYRL